MSLPEYGIKDADEVRVPGDLGATPERGNCAHVSFCTTFTYSTSTAMGWHWTEPRLSMREFHTRIKGKSPRSWGNHTSLKSSTKLAVYTSAFFRWFSDGVPGSSNGIWLRHGTTETGERTFPEHYGFLFFNSYQSHYSQHIGTSHPGTLLTRQHTSYKGNMTALHAFWTYTPLPIHD